MLLDWKIIWSILEKIISAAQAALPSLIVAAFYSVSVYGEFIYSYSISVLISSCVVVVDDKILKNRYLLDGDENLFSIAATIRVVLILLSSIILYLIHHFFNLDISFSFTLGFLIFFLTTNLSYGYTIKLQSNLEMKTLTIIRMISLVSALSLCLYFSSHNYEVIYNIYALILGAIINFLLFLLFVELTINLKDLQKSIIKIKGIVSDSIPFGIAAISYLIYMRMDTLMVDYFLSKVEVGIYGLAIQGITICTMILAPIQVVAFPILRKTFHRKDKYELELVKYTSLAMVLFSISSLFVFFIIYYFVDVVSPEFYDSISIFLILLFSALITTISVLRSSHIAIVNAGRILLITQLIALFINFILNFSLIPIIGLKGAALSTLISQFCSLILSNFYFKDLRFFFKIQLKSINIFNTIK